MTTLENADSKLFWEGVRQGRLLLQRCAECQHTQFPPRHMCARCWTEDLRWIESSGRGVVESFSIVHRAPTPALRDSVPYVVAAVLLEEGPRMITNIVSLEPLSTVIGDKVEVVFAADSQGRVLPQFRGAGRDAVLQVAPA